jgi:hypothetical protein
MLTYKPLTNIAVQEIELRTDLGRGTFDFFLIVQVAI